MPGMRVQGKAAAMQGPHMAMPKELHQHHSPDRVAEAVRTTAALAACLPPQRPAAADDAADVGAAEAAPLALTQARPNCKGIIALRRL
mmetsp:Transcript_37688/g.108144  ORF Transcript_37688/g.108144 Transcript_37688/m.108144 type:complete len:88 (-) Transcript_37688:292-555(-)